MELGMTRTRIRLSSLVLVAGALFVAAVPRGIDGAEPTFLRGDANADGVVSISDVLTIRRYCFNGDTAPPCENAADANADQRTDIADMVFLAYHLFMPDGTAPAAPFPIAGVDPSEGGLPCLSDVVTPAPRSSDLVRIGRVEGAPGEPVAIPIFITNSVSVEALQLALSYDPEVFMPDSDWHGFDFEGTPWETSFDNIRNPVPDPAKCFHSDCGIDHPFFVLYPYPESGVFTIGILAHWLEEGFEFPAGPERLAFKIRGTVSPNAQPGNTIRLDPFVAPPGEDLLPPFSIRNELTHRGGARYVSVLPRLEGGELRIIDDITFFIRGDANRDAAVDISDALFTLGYLFVSGAAPSCLDAADADDNGEIELTDAIVTLGQLFLNEGPIAPPYPSRGPDTTPDAFVDCAR